MVKFLGLDKFLGYDDPSNFDVTYRPTPKALAAGLWFAFFVNAFMSAIGPIVIYVLTVHPPQAGTALAITVISVGIGTGIYFPRLKRIGRRKRMDFTHAGGDPSEYSDLQCGIMGGSHNSDGIWQWEFPR